MALANVMALTMSSMTIRAESCQEMLVSDTASDITEPIWVTRQLAGSFLYFTLHNVVAFGDCIHPIICV